MTTVDFDLLLEGVSTIFESLGRALICLNRDFRVVHASPGLNHLLGEGAIEAVLGADAAEVLGKDLFGPEGTLRHALESGQRREGWGATIQVKNRPPRLISISAAPIVHGPGAVCDPRVTYVVVLRAGEEEGEGGGRTVLFSSMVARSGAMLRVFRLVEQLGESEATVLITGESGTGKELVARAVHTHSPRRGGPFVAVNCGALPGELLESELFGHVRGAFTGAVRDRLGRFELASGGTIFLDEIGDLPLHLQVKLLRVLQEKSFERVGESSPRTTDARVIAATHYDLRRKVLEGDFRDDLYYRLRVVPIEIPPLRERREDIESLARHLLMRVGRRHDRSLRFSPEALRALLRYDWPGNVRELENALEYAMAVTRGQTIRPQDLPLEVQEPSTHFPDSDPSSSPPRPRTQSDRSEPERERIRAALEAHQWRRSQTAEALGISRTTLWRRMRELGLMR